MIIKGRSRGAVDELATHLARADTNERVEVLESRGTIATDLRGALREMAAVAAGSASRKPIYHASISPRTHERLTVDQWKMAIDRLEERLGLQGQPRVIVMHEKLDREHIHVVWGRIDREMHAIPDSHNYRAHEEVARELEREFGHEMTQGVHVDRDEVARRPRTRTHADQQQSARTDVDIDALSAAITGIWQSTTTGLQFVDELRERGYRIAIGDRRTFVLLDRRGGVHALARRIVGVRTADIRERMADVDLSALPSVAAAREDWRTEERASVQLDLNQDARRRQQILDGLFRTRSYVMQYEVVRAFEDAGVRHPEAQAEIMFAAPDILALVEPGTSDVIGYTTREIRKREEELLASASVLANQRAQAIGLDRVADAAILSVEQHTAATKVLSGARCSMLIGRAGTGKSKTLSVVRQAAQDQGYEVIALAPTNAVAQDLRDAGFGRATTVHSLLWYQRHAPDHAFARFSRKALFVVDEAAMLDTRRLADVVEMVSRAGPHARLVLVGDDRQLESVETGGMFGPIARLIGAAELTEVRRQERHWARRASQAFAEGRFRDGLEAMADRGQIAWSSRLDDARTALLARYERDTETGRGKRFVFAYTNEEVGKLNTAIQQIEIDRGRVTNVGSFKTTRGLLKVGEGDRVSLRGTDKRRGLTNGLMATVTEIHDRELSIRTDRGRQLTIDLDRFDDIELGYAGTIYRGQGKTLDEAYLLHTRHWRDATSYVALTRSKMATQVFVARDQAEDLQELAAQMERQNNRGATINYAEKSQSTEFQRQKLSVLEKEI